MRKINRKILKAAVLVLILMLVNGCGKDQNSENPAMPVTTEPGKTTPQAENKEGITPEEEDKEETTSGEGKTETGKYVEDAVMVDGYYQISQETAVKIMEAESGYIILDVRTLEEYNDSHIPGAICVPNEEIGTAEISELPDKEQLILVYCRSGRRSKEASKKLAAMGYTEIYEFGGIIDWTGETVSEN